MIQRMIGTLVNAAGIMIGGIVGLARPGFSLSRSNEDALKVVLAALTVFCGLRLTWANLSGSWSQILKQLLIVIVAMILGKLAGRLLRLQNASNALGGWARDRISVRKPGDPNRASDGFKVCAALFCAAPLGILGATQDGLNSPPYFYPLAIKGVIDGLAALGFVALFGWGVLLAVIPVLAFQGTITLLCSEWLGPFLCERGLVSSVNAVGGLLVFSVALVILGLKKIEITDYLPSLILAPLITWLWR
ncbi:MAG TPA: DUF554 family protein [Verrucomicrobiae bacterium]